MGPDSTALNIAGIDTALGLKSIGGKRERYESLLRKFAERQAGTARPFELLSRSVMHPQLSVKPTR